MDLLLANQPRQQSAASMLISSDSQHKTKIDDEDNKVKT